MTTHRPQGRIPTCHRSHAGRPSAQRTTAKDAAAMTTVTTATRFIVRRASGRVGRIASVELPADPIPVGTRHPRVPSRLPAPDQRPFPEPSRRAICQRSHRPARSCRNRPGRRPAAPAGCRNTPGPLRVRSRGELDDPEAGRVQSRRDRLDVAVVELGVEEQVRQRFPGSDARRVGHDALSRTGRRTRRRRPTGGPPSTPRQPAAARDTRARCAATPCW